jgi:hypothetical protein
MTNSAPSEVLVTEPAVTFQCLKAESPLVKSVESL